MTERALFSTNLSNTSPRMRGSLWTKLQKPYPTKNRSTFTSLVLETYARLKGRLENLAPQLCRASGFAFYNTSPYTFERLLADAPHLAANLRTYITSFSENMREVLEKFDFENTISKLDETGLLFLVLERFKNIDLHPNVVSNIDMGYIF